MSLPPPYSSVKQLGDYDQLPEDVKIQLAQLPNLPPSVNATAQAAILEYLEDADTQDKLMEEVKALGDSVFQVDASFERVRVGLGKVDQNDYKDKHGDRVARFQPTWLGYQARWTALLWGSRDVATKTEAYIKDFLNVIVPQVESIKNLDDLADARLDLEAFVKRKEPKQLNSDETADQAMKYSQEFTDLRRDLEAFKDTFDDFAKDQKVELDTGIKDKDDYIQALDLEIEQCQAVVSAMGIAFGVTLWVTGAGAITAIAALGPLGPVVATGIIIIGAIAAITELAVLIAYVVKTSEKQAERRKAQRELEDLKAQLKSLEELQAILQSQKADITNICARLDRFAAIWGLVRHDASLINADLNAAVGDEGSKAAFQKRIDLLKNSYTKLRDALNLYATTINDSKLKA